MEGLADWLGIPLSDEQHRQLEAFGRWLASEAVTAGGIGPNEVDRLFDRHVGDAMTYLSQVPPSAETVVDVGSGVGLPGIPLAIVRPDLGVTLVDRSGRRVDLARRAARVAGVDGLTVVHGDVTGFRQVFDVAVFRASLPPMSAARTVLDLVGPDGRGVLGLSRLAVAPEPPEVPEEIHAEIVRLAPPMLASPVWLLRMHRSAE